ncbi:unnamed protein product, partial [Nippostrongylus brasiliensis]|uniref:Mediator of RNA polymerase II transcription subunit 22 n=1 Tax=Nippostrongylus brasiliensis TaxID=27835 RepID=A0A0N4XKB5_NIPBR
MSAQLITQKRLLSRYGNKLEKVISSFKEECLEGLQVSEGSSRTERLDSIRRLEESIGAIEAVTAKLENTLGEYTVFVDSDGKVPASEWEQYVETAESSLAKALDYLVLLKARLRSFKAAESL